MNDLLVDRTTKRVRMVRSKLKLIAAHLACGRMGSPRRDRFPQGERDREWLMAGSEILPCVSAHKFTRANDFSGLSALLRNSLRFRPSVPAYGKRASFRPAKRNVSHEGL
jgi:hypothetical protein